MLNANEVLYEGYEKVRQPSSALILITDDYDEQYKGGCYKIAQFNRWFVIVTDPVLNEELRKAPDELLSSPAALHEVKL